MRLVKVIFKLKNKYGADLVDTQILNLQVNIFNTSALIGKVMRSTTEFEVAYFEDIDASLDPVAYNTQVNEIKNRAKIAVKKWCEEHPYEMPTRDV